MQIKTDSFIFNPCDEEEDDMALVCCHGSNGELFLLARFPDEDEVDITFIEDTIHVSSNLKVTFSAQRLLIELDPADAKQLDGHTEYEILHGMAADELIEVEETLVIILEGVGTYVSEIG